MRTLVIFLKDKHPYTDSAVFAYFPDEIRDSQGNKTSYTHIGQHGACSYEYANECKEAKPSEYNDLKEELKNIGYKLQVI